MKKIVFGAILVLFVTLGFGVYYLLSNLDDIVKVAIETYGSEATGTAVQVERVKIGLSDGTGEVSGLTVGNPKGFEAEQAFSLGEVSTQIDLKSLSGDVIVIEQITVRAPKVFFELNAAGKSNLNELKQNLSSGDAKPSTQMAKQGNGAEPKLIIRNVLFTGGAILAKVVPLNKEYELALPEIAMTNLGGKNGATPTQIADQIVKALSDRALAEIKKQGVDQYRQKLEGEVNKRLDAEQQKLNEKLGDKIGDQVGEKLKGVLNY